MTLRVYIIIFLVCILGKIENQCNAQNIVNNGSFEFFHYESLLVIDDWHEISSPDYWTLNIPPPYVPCNPFGCEGPIHQNSYFGLSPYFLFAEYREYIQNTLQYNLYTGNSYCFNFYISLADSSNFAINSLGINFTDSLYGSLQPGWGLINLEPSILTDTFITSKSGWTQFHTKYIANGTEKYLTIGNFYPDSTTGVVWVPGGGGAGYEGTYYYVDSVSLSRCRPPVFDDTLIDLLHGETIIIGDTAKDVAVYSWSPVNGLESPYEWQTNASPAETTTYTLTKITPCDTTESKITIRVSPPEDLPFLIFPNPAENQITILYSLTEADELLIYDMTGRIVERLELEPATGVSIDIDLSIYAAGAYSVKMKNGNFQKLFVIIR
jgi:hypothetical protein